MSVDKHPDKLSVKEWFNEVVMDPGPSGWIWKTGLIATVLFIIAIIYGRVGAVHVRVISPSRVIDHVQTVLVLSEELDEPVAEAVAWNAEHGCYFEVVDSDYIMRTGKAADWTVELIPELVCNDNESAGCTSWDSKQILLMGTSPKIASHELLHAHNLQHPLLPPTGHRMHPVASSVGDNDHGIASACAETRGYPIPFGQ